MAQPTRYTPSYNFSDFQASSPSTPLPADKVDVQFNLLKNTTDEICNNLAAIQRDDGRLANQVVTPESFSPAALIAISGFTPRGAWLTATTYAIGDMVTQSGATYVAAADHTSGVFATDLAAAKWIIIAGASASITLDDLTNVTAPTPASGNLLSFNGSNWVNAFLALSNVPDGLLTFAKLASGVSNADGTLASVSDTQFPTSQAVKTYVTTSLKRDTGTNVTAAATINLTGNYDYVTVTGNTNISAVTLAEDEEKWVSFTGTPTLLHNATSFILPGGANIPVAANDRALFRGLASGNVICLAFQRANGKAIAETDAVRSVKLQVKTATGTYTPSTGMVNVLAFLTGSGGGGGGGNTGSGGGGGAGETAVGIFSAADIGASQSVTIGAGGSGGSSTTDGSAGSTSSIGSLLSAAGGSGGLKGVNGVIGDGGAGGTGGTGGTFRAVGGGGGSGFEYPAGGAGMGGHGGASFWGGGAIGKGGIGDFNGATGSAYGSGGGGGGQNGTGGAGKDGFAVFVEFCSQ